MERSGITRWFCSTARACDGGVFKTRAGTKTNRLRPGTCNECRRMLRDLINAGELQPRMRTPDNVRELPTFTRPYERAAAR